MLTLPRRPALAAALFVLALLVTACGDDPTAPRSTPNPASVSRTPDVAVTSLSGSPSELLTQLAAGKCADVSGERQVAKARLVIYTCHGTGNQLFTFPAMGTTGQIHVYDDATCVDASGALGRDGDPIIIYPCNGGANQQWTITAQGEIKGINGKCIDVSNADSTDGRRLILYTCHSSSNQRWTFGTAPVLARDLAAVRGDQAGVAAAPAIVATFNVSSAASARATITAPDGSVRTTAPVQVVSGHARVVVLGLRPATQYTVTAVALSGGQAVSTSAPSAVTTASLPSALVGVTMNLSGGAPSSGYVLTPVIASNGYAYAVAFDTTGAIAWYREFAGKNIFDLQQQPNGHYTAYVGELDGDNNVYHEFDAEGTIVHDWTAPAGYITDVHEIILQSDATGRSTAAWLFGRRNIKLDLSAIGGSKDADTQESTIFRITADGQATALFKGTDRFTAKDWIAPPFQLYDFDHPNAMSLTPDGGFLVSWRNLSAITKHDASGRVQWQLGGRQSTITYVGDSADGFQGQHFVRPLPNGHFTLFDNGILHNPSESRGMEIALDASAKTATVVRVDRDRAEVLYTPNQGSYQRLSNGNGVLAYTQLGRVVEVNPSGSVVWQGRLVRADGTKIIPYRVLRIPYLDHYGTL